MKSHVLISIEQFFSVIINFHNISSLSRGKKCDSVFKQVAKHVLKQKPKDLCFPSRTWKIRLVDEAADDAGGVFDEIMTEMCQVIPNICLLFYLSCLFYHLTFSDSPHEACLFRSRRFYMFNILDKSFTLRKKIFPIRLRARFCNFYIFRIRKLSNNQLCLCHRN